MRGNRTLKPDTGLRFRMRAPIWGARRACAHARARVAPKPDPDKLDGVRFQWHSNRPVDAHSLQGSVNSLEVLSTFCQHNHHRHNPRSNPGFRSSVSSVSSVNTPDGTFQGERQPTSASSGPETRPKPRVLEPAAHPLKLRRHRHLSRGKNGWSASGKSHTTVNNLGAKSEAPSVHYRFAGSHSGAHSS